LLVRSIFDECPETKEPQAVHGFRMDGSAVIFETRGKTRAWRHRITTEEIDLPPDPETEKCPTNLNARWCDREKRWRIPGNRCLACSPIPLPNVEL
jgi:hypothetical protein